MFYLHLAALSHHTDGSTCLITMWAARGDYLQGTMSKVTLKTGFQAQGQPPNRIKKSLGSPCSGKGVLHFAQS